MNQDHTRQLGKYIRHIRIERHETIRALAAQAGIDSGGLARLENGKVGTPRPDTLRALAHALDVSPADLFAMAGYTVPHDLPGHQTISTSQI
jgi:transcriptional regulator with XRE-family HTH domain